MTDLSEQRDSLWWLVISPTIWAVHFLACYITAAVWCARVVGRTGTLTPVRVAIAVYSVAALVVIVGVAVRGYRRHSFGTATVPHDFDTPEDRHRFLGFSSLLLSGVSAVGVVYVGLTAVFFASCR